eukprot:CAMPEP_0180558940 /NCGR_PEP_ID=MMETSP1037_2-20121125/2025_1 /TAXON_ID=632150 /ORGANISM="Azadinium spinosum, Strain 3D9" /LENGTH=262 /DNA_ID=CAMNT_0022575367 /DNA_START=179 /DNA_END=964 /DNA_ORIENTATION=-
MKPGDEILEVGKAVEGHKLHTNRDVHARMGTKRDKLLEHRGNFLTDGTLTVQLALRRYEKAVSVRGSSIEPPRHTIGDSLREILLSGQGADVELLAEGVKLHAHKFILRPVFRAMLETNMSEGISSVIDLPEVDKTTAQALLEFLYTDTCALLEDADGICHLIKAAHRFDIADLVQCCMTRILSGLSPASAVERLMLADELCLEELRCVCVETGVAAYLGFQLLKAVVAPSRKRKAESPEWGSMNLVELRGACQKRGLPTSG